ncbi:hypothetical protein GCM10023220_01110 [Streptomyces ziwulingensis]|uniref:Uncharacterized protein n=1 Tax=Streptomyces ziwulingensis TaxID=1045501 RepID=A0ABP9AKR2_9ACTN
MWWADRTPDPGPAVAITVWGVSVAAVVQDGRGDGAGAACLCGVCVKPGDPDEGVDYADGLTSGVGQFHG